MDYSNWVDTGDYNCTEWEYDPTWYSEYSSSASEGGIPVTEACCVCGGGYLDFSVDSAASLSGVVAYAMAAAGLAMN